MITVIYSISCDDAELLQSSVTWSFSKRTFSRNISSYYQCWNGAVFFSILFIYVFIV